MKIKENCSIFSIRPSGVLKSSVSNLQRTRTPLTLAFDNQNLKVLSKAIDSLNTNQDDILKNIPPGMIFFSVLEDAYFIIKDGYDGIILTKDHALIKESLCYSKNKLDFDLDLDLNKAKELNEVFIAFDAKWMRYDHWLGYCLSKSHLASLYTPLSMQIAVPEYREKSSYIFNPISQQLYLESLERTELKKRVTFLKDGIYKAKKLTSFQPNSHLPQDYFNFGDAKRLFNMINRNYKYNNALPSQFMITANHENVNTFDENYNRIMTIVCNELDIPIINLQKLDWKTQISLFSQAEFIITPHCPELINLYFCQAETKILELTHLDKNQFSISAWPFLIASSNNMNYSFIDDSSYNLDINNPNQTINFLKQAILKLRIL